MRGLKLFTFFLMTVFLVACAQVQPQAKGPEPAPVQQGLARIAAQGELVVGTTGSQPPLTFVSRTGEVMGLDVDLARSIADAMGVKLRIETMAFADLLPALNSGRVDMILSGMTMTPKRNMNAAFVGPYFVSGKAILTKEQTLADVKDPSEMDRPALSLAALKGSTSQTFVEQAAPHAKLVPVDNYDEGVQLVLQDQVDALVADYPICVISVFRHPEADLVSLITPLTFEPLGVALPAEDPLFANWMNNFLLLLDGRGELEQMTQKWFGDAAWLKMLP